MHKLLPVLVLFATAAGPSLAWALDFRPIATSKPENPVQLAGGMGGGTGGMGGAGMGGMGGGGMTGGGMGGMGTGMGGMGAGMGGMGAGGGYGFSPGAGFGRTDTATDPSSGGGAQPSQYYQCVTPYDRCSLAASPGSMHSGSACTCSTGHTGKIK